ncbi:MAG: isoprenylcysteine carboxylmethyltransferase family protein [Acidobacteria bacterium]|nr:isoprenylcysteine carboxylmethyltransferase family protein [Acidobacteriota bacterium]
MTPLDLLAGAMLFVEWPVPLYWLILHPWAKQWRGREKAGLISAAVIAWGLGATLLFGLRRWLFAGARAEAWEIAAGLTGIAIDLAMLVWVQREMGASRLVGHTELRGEGELNVRGIYARIRHPRYLAMMAGVLGACLLAGTLLTWVLSIAWWGLALLAIALEERELYERFGVAYGEYCARTGRFFPRRPRAILIRQKPLARRGDIRPSSGTRK